MNPSQDNLESWFAAARADLACEVPPPWVEAALKARQEGHALLVRLRPRVAPPVRRARGWRRWWLAPAAIAIALVAGVGLLLALAATTPRGHGRDTASFTALSSLDAIAAEPNPLVVTSAVPRAQLAAYGLPVDPARADQPVRAEFLVSRRGAVLAVRFSPE